MLNKRRQLLLRWGGLSVAAAVALGAAAYLARHPAELPATETGEAAAGITSVLSRNATSDMVRFHFENARQTAGIDFHHFPATRQSLLPEDMGSGLAWGDYDNDGDPDLFLVNFAGPILESLSAQSGRSALYRNEGSGRFIDVSQSAGLDWTGFGMAACWGDYDNDEDLDLYLSGYGPNHLYRNKGDGSFEDVTETAGVGDARFSAGCGWADYDRDGNIDLYVSNYVDFVLRDADRSRSARQYGSEIPYTINPSSYPPAGNRLYRNLGDGRFVDMAPEAGVEDPEGRSLGVVWFDMDNDGMPDLYVANDISSNAVFHNLGDGRFADIGAKSLAADYRGAMGLAVGDYEHDGDLDLFVTHWLAQENAFFENMLSEAYTDDQGNARLFFMDSADLLGLGQQSLKMVGWAAGFADFDNDGHPDLWVVNGNTLEQSGDNTRLKPQPMHLFRQEPGKGFFEIGRQACPELARPFVGRGGAHADYDGDGRMDIAVMAFGEQPLLLHNVSGNSNHWLSLRLRQTGGNTRALGTRVSLRVDGRTQTAQVGVGGSYLSQHDTDLHFGLGSAERVEELTIRWPDGSEETHSIVGVDRLLRFDHVVRGPDETKRGFP